MIRTLGILLAVAFALFSIELDGFAPQAQVVHSARTNLDLVITPYVLTATSKAAQPPSPQS
jgi:hypothetical protein